MTIIIFIIVLLVCVIAHEWGHFFAARKSGMLVEEFGFGIPPKLWSWKKGETTYSINALPIGGFVKIAGENGLDESIPSNRQFESKPWYLKSIVLVAGVLCNVILAFVLFTAAYTIGMPAIVATGGVPTIVDVVPGSPAAQAGLLVGDTVESVVVSTVPITTITTEALHKAITTTTGDVVLVYTRSNETRTATITPAVEKNNRKIGVGIAAIANEKQPLFTAMKYAAMQTVSVGGTIFVTLGSLIKGLFGDSSVAGNLIGPVGLAHEVGNAATMGFTYLLAFTAMISVNLAVLNIMPFPALDGGRLIIVLLEAITRRRFSQKIVAIIHTSGFLLLLGLMLYLTIGDIGRLL